MPTAPVITVITTGGTIDKEYPCQGGYAFEFGETSAAARIIETVLPCTCLDVAFVPVCQKDSTEITASDRMLLSSAIRAARGDRIVVTHGTDTLIRSAQIVQQSNAAAGKRVVFTGAMQPERFRDSDASFNLGGAIAATEILPSGSVFICMGGRVIPANECVRDPTSGRFGTRGPAVPMRSNFVVDEEPRLPRPSSELALDHVSRSWQDEPISCSKASAPPIWAQSLQGVATNMPAAGLSTQSAEYGRLVWSAPTVERVGRDASGDGPIAHHAIASPPRRRWLKPRSLGHEPTAAGYPTELGSDAQVLWPATRSAPNTGYAQCGMRG
jgi:L-asparaginase